MRLAGLAIMGAAAATTFAVAQGRQSPSFADELSRGPVLVELFTSQGCSSCPPAEALFETLAEDENLVVVEWHVDYWDDLVYGAAGRWEDPYSAAEHTRRQRNYNRDLVGRPSAYTPQAVIAGISEGVGSRETVVRDLIASAPAVSVHLDVTADRDGFRVDAAPALGRSDAEGEVIFVRMLKEIDTNVAGGENKGRRLTGANVAVETRSLGAWTGAPTTYAAPALDEGETCAIIVHEGGRAVGPALGAAYCPV